MDIKIPQYTPYQNIRAENVYNAMKHEADKLDRECFWVVLLDVKNKIIGTNLVSMGSLVTTVIHPREVFKPAILRGEKL